MLSETLLPEYSMKKMVEYSGEETPVTVYWNVEEMLVAGDYHVAQKRQNRILVVGDVAALQAFSPDGEELREVFLGL